MSTHQPVMDVLLEAMVFLPEQTARKVLSAAEDINKLLEALKAERAMEASGERPSIDDERAIYARTDTALAVCQGMEQTDGR